MFVLVHTLNTATRTLISTEKVITSLRIAVSHVRFCHNLVSFCVRALQRISRNFVAYVNTGGISSVFKVPKSSQVQYFLNDVNSGVFLLSPKLKI